MLLDRHGHVNNIETAFAATPAAIFVYWRVPPRPPPAPPVLTALSCLSAAAAAYAAMAIDQAGRGAGGLLAGLVWRGVAAPPPAYLPRVALDGTPGTPLGWVMLVLAGPAVLAAAAVSLYAAVSLFRTSGVMRSLTLSFTVLALFWLPTELVAAALPGGGGPIAELYEALGNPPAGRWSTLALGALLLWGVAGYVSRRAVATGRAWMRADAPEFRRRLVRVVAGYPAGGVLALMAVVLGWMSPGVALVWGLLVLTTLMARTG